MIGLTVLTRTKATAMEARSSSQRVPFIRHSFTTTDHLSLRGPRAIRSSWRRKTEIIRKMCYFIWLLIMPSRTQAHSRRKALAIEQCQAGPRDWNSMIYSNRSASKATRSSHQARRNDEWLVFSIKNRGFWNHGVSTLLSSQKNQHQIIAWESISFA